MSFNVNCSDCKHCSVYLEGWDDEDHPIPCYMCTKDAPFIVEVDVINNIDCCFFELKE